MISLFVAVSSATGYVLGSDRIHIDLATVFSGVFLLSSGSATLNNLQDRKSDRRFRRTRDRAFARRLIPLSHGLFQAAILMFAGGSLLLMAQNGLVVLTTGLLAIVCYNGLYTPFKRRTYWAILPGIVSGMIPPMMGWLAAGGFFWSYRIWLFMVLLALWQPPHAWLILLANADEFNAAEHRRSLHSFNVDQARMVALSWVFCFSAAIALFPLYGVVQNPIAASILVLTAFMLVASYGYLTIFHRVKGYDRMLFLQLNGTLALVMLLCIFDNVL